MKDVLEIRLPGRPSYLSTVRSFFRALVRDTPGIRLEPRETTEMQLVLQEACINAIRHGSGRGPAEEVRVRFLLHDDGLTIEVHDHGRGFDPDEIPDPDAEGLQEGGYGVWIMKQSMDRVETRRTPGGFVLSLTKKYRTAAPSEIGAR